MHDYQYNVNLSHRSGKEISHVLFALIDLVLQANEASLAPADTSAAM
jgi:hypothetical protein